MSKKPSPDEQVKIEDQQELIKINGGFKTSDRNIPVMAEDIQHAVARDQHNCAIVRAIQRRYPESIRVRANTKYIGFTIGEERYTYPTPPEAIEAIIKPLDTGTVPEPITVRLRAGKVRPVEHKDNRALTETRQHWRGLSPETKDNFPSRRAAQMSPNGREVHRFTDLEKNE